MKHPAFFVLVIPALMFQGCSSSQPEATTQDVRQTTTDEASASNPLYPFTLMRQGSVLLQQGRTEDALKLFEEAARLQPSNATVFNMIGLCNLKMEKYPEALDAFNAALQLIPTFSDARNNRGATYLAMGQYHLAEVDFLAVLGDNTYPHHWDIYYNLGMVYFRQDRLAAAEENFNRAATAPKPVYEAFLRLAEINLRRNRTDAAIQILEEARLKNPDRLEAPLELGKILLGEGRTEEARTYLDEVLRAAPGSDFAKQAKELLEGN